MAGDSQEVRVESIHPYGDLANGLRGVDVKEYPARFCELADLLDRPNRSHFIVGMHDRDEVRDTITASFEESAGIEDNRVFDY